MHDKRGAQREEAVLRRGQASTLFTRLLRKLAGAPAQPATDALAEPGRRSGRGAATIAPYLEHGRNTRPGDLE